MVGRLCQSSVGYYSPFQIAHQHSYHAASPSSNWFSIITKCRPTRRPPTFKGGGSLNVIARVCRSVCLLARLLKNTCMDLDEMLRVDTTDVGTWTNWLTFEPDPDYSPDAGTGLLSMMSYKRRNAELYYVGKISRIRIGRPSLQRGVVLKWFYSPRAVGTPLSEVHALYRVPF